MLVLARVDDRKFQHRDLHAQQHCTHYSDVMRMESQRRSLDRRSQ